MEMRFQNILIIKPSALGDVVHALPVLDALRRTWPDARITWMIRREFAPLLECVRGLDETLLFERRRIGRWYTPDGWAALQALIQRLRNDRYDLVLDLQGLFRTALFARLSGCPVRVGMATARECAPLLYTHRVQPPADSRHMVDSYRTMLDAVGVSDFQTQVTFQPPASALQAVSHLLEDEGLTPNRFAVLIPGAAHATKQWPTERFAAVAERLAKEYGLAVAAVGTAGEKRIVTALQQNCAVPIVDLTGKTTIPQLVALLAQAAMVVSNETGPGHIAVAQNTPSVLIFGPTNPAWVGPYKQPEACVAIEPHQRGKAIRSRKPAHRIEQITVQTVMDAVRRRLTPDHGDPRQ